MKEKCEALLEEIRRQLLQAQISLDIWLALLPMESNDVMDTVNMFKGFFIPTRAAHLDRCLIKIGNTLDKKHKKAASFYRLLSMLEQEPGIAPDLNLESVRKQLDGWSEVERKVMRLRDKTATHWEIGAAPEPVYIEEIRQLLISLEEVFNIIHKAIVPKESWSFQLLESEDTSGTYTAWKVFTPFILLLGS